MSWLRLFAKSNNRSEKILGHLKVKIFWGHTCIEESIRKVIVLLMPLISIVVNRASDGRESVIDGLQIHRLNTPIAASICLCTSHR